MIDDLLIRIISSQKDDKLHYPSVRHALVALELYIYTENQRCLVSTLSHRTAEKVSVPSRALLLS
jgi:hypothetical protein